MPLVYWCKDPETKERYYYDTDDLNNKQYAEVCRLEKEMHKDCYRKNICRFCLKTNGENNFLSNQYNNKKNDSHNKKDEWDYYTIGGRYANLLPISKRCKMYHQDLSPIWVWDTENYHGNVNLHFVNTDS